MLARNFKTAEDLQLSEVEVQSLIKVLGMLERGELSATKFDGKILPKTICMMSFFMTDTECGTVGCIAGTANLISNGSAFPELDGHQRLANLSERISAEAKHAFMLYSSRWSSIAPPTEEITDNLRNFLTTGSIKG